VPTDGVVRVGRALRRVPGAAPLLDRRLRAIRRRAERSEAKAQTARDQDAARLRALGARGGLRINVGCGPESVDGWVNVDIVCDWQGVLYMDATSAPWPLPDGCADAINSEHFIEHVSTDEARAYLSAAAGALRPGGVIRTSTPSLRGIVGAYLNADPSTLATHRDHGYDACSHADLLNNYFFEWGHRHIYDFESLAALHEEAGFSSIEEAEFGQSRHALLQGVDRHDLGPLQRLVLAVDAVRP
jgi:predicted SAM-dependent methyltransferase